jgi:DNA-binding beta-propeller fold protein YncE
MKAVMLRGDSRQSGLVPDAIWAVLLLPVFLIGCASTPDPEDTQPLFYPSLPNPPRIQFLKTYTTTNDLGRDKSALAEFVVGQQDRESALVEKPYGVGIHGGNIYVVDTRGPGYGVFDLNLRKFRFVAGNGAGVMRKPINITIDANGIKYVTDTGRNQVLVYDQNDRFLRAYGKTNQFKPSDVALLEDKLYIADVGNHRIHVLDRQSGKTLLQFGKPGSKPGELFHPTNLAISPDKTVLVSDTSNYRIQEFSSDGKYLRHFGSVGSGLGKFARPKGIAIDHDKRLYIVDAAFENVQILNPDGKLLLFFGGPGDKRGNINLPTKITIDYVNAPLFQQYAAPGFDIEYLILVASQFGVNKVNVYGFGKMRGLNYPSTEQEFGNAR